MVIAQSASLMDLTICFLHPLSQEANIIIEDSRNVDLLCLGCSTIEDARGSLEGEGAALSLTLDRMPKKGSDFVIGRHEDADVVLSDPTCSARHCTISVDCEGVAVIHEQSKNGTIINGKLCKGDSVALCDKMKIELQKAVFLIRIPWRRGPAQADYAYKAKRVNETRAATPLLDSSSIAAPVHTAWVATLGPYEMVGTSIEKIQAGRKEIASVELVRKGCCWFTAKRYHEPALARRELQIWKGSHHIKHVGHMSISSLNVANLSSITLSTLKMF